MKLLLFVLLGGSPFSRREGAQLLNSVNNQFRPRKGLASGLSGILKKVPSYLLQVTLGLSIPTDSRHIPCCLCLSGKVLTAPCAAQSSGVSPWDTWVLFPALTFSMSCLCFCFSICGTGHLSRHPPPRPHTTMDSLSLQVPPVLHCTTLRAPIHPHQAAVLSLGLPATGSLIPVGCCARPEG